MHILSRLPIGLLLFGFALPAGAQESGQPVTVDVPAPVVTADAPAVAPGSVAERLTYQLSGYEYFPKRADLDAVGSADEIAALLREFVTDVDLRPSTRLRAVDALGYYDDEASVALLTRLCTEEPKADLPRRKLRTAGLLRHHAITALARSTRGASVPVLEAVLQGDDLQLTLTAVHALGKHGGKDGREAIGRLAAQTKNNTVRREAEKWVK